MDHRDSTILKGLAIAAIVFHNFFHLINPARENEFTFHPGGLAVFVETVRHPSLAIQAIFSFFGYLGVPVFIFLSAYGLTKSHWNSPATWTQFMAGRIRKTFPIFAVVVLPWMIAIGFQNGLHPFLHDVLPQMAYLFTGLTPFIPGHSLPPVGPWWFIPFILEFYAIFFVLRWVTEKFGWRGLFLIAGFSLVVTALSASYLERSGINLYETPFGRMPSCCLGIAAARYPFRLRAPVVLLAGAVLVLGSQFAVVWPLTFVAALVLTLQAYMVWRVPLKRSWILERAGRYSMLVFLVNGIMRCEFLDLATTPARQLLFGTVSALASFALAAAIQEFLFARPRAGANLPMACLSPRADSRSRPQLANMLQPHGYQR